MDWILVLAVFFVIIGMIGIYVKDKRKKRGVHQAELVDAMNIYRNQHGYDSFPLFMFGLLEEILNGNYDTVSVDEFIKIVEERDPESSNQV